MTKRKKILIISLAAILVALAALGLWQRNNIHALYIYLTQDSAAIAHNLEQRWADRQRALEERGVEAVPPPTLEQSGDLLSGAVGAQQVKDEMGLSEQLAIEPVTAEDLISQCVAELYACKVDTMAQLGGMKQAALDQWRALAPEQRTETVKREISLNGLEACYGLEIVVDGQVREILDRYRAPLTAAGGDAAILDELWTYYVDEKASEKAYYMDKYLE